ncbi:hypothetical protein M0802_012924 [Mischocyttarus mexicanus]|nr:hypothetical protein M0802_012924 [Mischocyttarus mexicanus]
MGTLQQQSILKGRQVNGNREVELLHKLFSETAVRYADDIAIISEDTNDQIIEVTYKQLDKLTNKLARSLKKYADKTEITGQPLVVVSMKPTEKLPIILLSILKAGMVYLPLDPEFPSARLKHILQEAEPTVVMLEKDANISLYTGTITKTYEQLLDEARVECDYDLEYDDNPKQLAIILYTSGSTGIPKGVLIRHSTILNRLNWQWRELPYLMDENRCIFKTALTFVDSVPEIWGPLLKGRTLVVVPKEVTRNPERFVRILEKHEIRRLVLVPSLLRSMLMYLKLQNKNVLSTLKLWICSGETLSVSLATEFFVTFHNDNRMLANFYGSTEIMGDVTYHIMQSRNDLQLLEKVPIGKPLDNCIVYLVNENMRLVPQGEIGELLVAGRNLAAGYLRDRESHRFLDNPYAIDPEYSRLFRTGDYAKIVKGTMVYEGRVDSQVKIRGHRVDLSEVEKLVSKISEIDKVVILCYKPGDLSQELLAFITVKENTKICNRDIEVSLQKRMPLYMQPQVIIVNQIPLLTNGKTDRQTLLKQYESSMVVNGNNEIPNCDYTGVSEEDLAKAKVLFPTIATVIGASSRGTVNLEGNFYQLGGNSLNSVYTVTKLRDQGYYIGITDFITATNLADILKRLKKSNVNDDTLKENINEEERYFEMLNDSHKDNAIEIITESFYSKADLEQWLINDINREDYRVLMDKLWEPLVKKDLSFVLKSSQNNQIIGIGLNFDVWDEPEVEIESKLSVIFEFLEYLEKPIREKKLPKGTGQIIHNFMMATHADLVPAENVIIMGEMEEYCLRIARKKEYAGIFTTNTSPLTQQLAIDVYGYETMLTYRVNEYVAPDNSKPFSRAPDSQVAICSLKMID